MPSPLQIDTEVALSLNFLAAAGVIAEAAAFSTRFDVSVNPVAL
jgi:hypothetical protein